MKEKEEHKTRRTLAIEIRAPEVLRISLILDPARPIMQPTMSAGMLMFWVPDLFSILIVGRGPRAPASESERRLYVRGPPLLKSAPFPVRITLGRCTRVSPRHRSFLHYRQGPACYRSEYETTGLWRLQCRYLAANHRPGTCRSPRPHAGFPLVCLDLDYPLSVDWRQHLFLRYHAHARNYPGYA